MITIKEIREALTLYFMRQLAEDEARRANRPPRGKEDVPEWSTLDKNEADPDNHVDDYLDHLHGELQFNFMGHSNLVLKIMEEYGIVTLDVTSDQFRMIYREFMKTEVEVMKVISKRIQCDYSDEMHFLWGNDIGLSSPAIALCDLSEPRSSMYRSFTNSRELQQKQLRNSHKGGQEKTRIASEGCVDFDACVETELSINPGDTNKHIAEICKKRTKQSRALRTLRDRVAEIKSRL